MLDFIYKRHSVRAFEDTQVPMKDLVTMLEAASYAPSGKNKQNWHYVIIKDQKLIHQIAQGITEVHDTIVQKVGDPEKTKDFTKFLPYYTLFKKAPMLVAIYAGHYEQKEIDLLRSIGMTEQAKRTERTNPGLQGVSASIENFMLTAANLGYGTCWMTGPCFASLAVEALIPFSKPGYELVALTPLGIPLNPGKSPIRKPLEEIYTVIDSDNHV